jgi:DNA-binding protein H-NS
LTLPELEQLLAQTNDAIAYRRIEELKVLADGYAKKLSMNGFSIREGMDALKPYLRIKR